jgi:hypothetical protein
MTHTHGHELSPPQIMQYVVLNRWRQQQTGLTLYAILPTRPPNTKSPRQGPSQPQPLLVSSHSVLRRQAQSAWLWPLTPRHWIYCKSLTIAVAIAIHVVHSIAVAVAAVCAG